MTQTFGTTLDTNDIYIAASGNLAVLNGQDAVLGACSTASKLQLGEAVLQTGLGIPNFQSVWVGVPNLAVFQQYLRRALESVDGVIRVSELTTKVSNNILSYTAKIQNRYGTQALSGQFNG